MVEDGGALMRDLSLGQAVVKDFANYRVLDRLMLYERRMENSMVKMIRELKQLQAERETEQAGTASCRGRLARASRGHLAHDLLQHSETNGRAAESPHARKRSGNLKKQSQFAADEMNVKPLANRTYDDTPPAAEAENKANPSQCGTPRCACQPVKGQVAAALQASQ
jgi:hypothetical protein